MSIVKAYSVVSTADLATARRWYTKLFGREPDRTPMSEVHEWYFGAGGVQLVQDGKRGGRSMLTLIVDDIDETRRSLAKQGLTLGAASGGDFATIAQIKDHEGNVITFSQPGPAADDMNSGMRSARSRQDQGTSLSSNVETTKSIFTAYVQKDRAAVEHLLTDDFRFTSPLDNALDRDTYLELCWPNSRTTASFDFEHVVEDGERVFVTYEATNSDGKRFRNTEILTIRQGRIARVEVYFGWNLPHEVPTGQHRDPR
jgi:ketosteroid isomerase-like protein/predicted enzyme related to lactoylglutathione lyase